MTQVQNTKAKAERHIYTKKNSAIYILMDKINNQQWLVLGMYVCACVCILPRDRVRRSQRAATLYGLRVTGKPSAAR